MDYNFYGWENAIVPPINNAYKGIRTPRNLYDVLTKLWCEYTCAPRLRSEWSEENVTLGQCSITAFLVQDIFGGEVYGILRPGGNYHCYNVIGDVTFDLTSEQFKGEVLNYEDNPQQFREVHFAKEEKRQRYEYLKEQLEKYKRKILITNDDGIDAEGLYRLTTLAMKYGEVWVVAPDGQRSASSHSITLHKEIDIYPYDYGIDGVKAFTCSGTPGDCVRVGSISVMPYRPDVVLSGINNGYNAATDIQYSGTCGAAFEAAFQGYQAIAVSEENYGSHEVTDRYLEELLNEVIDERLEFGQIWNLNFPGCSLSECKGVLRERSASHGLFYRDSYKVVEELQDGGIRYMVDGKLVKECEEGSDLKALIDNYVSVGIVNNVAL